MKMNEDDVEDAGDDDDDDDDDDGIVIVIIIVMAIPLPLWLKPSFPSPHSQALSFPPHCQLTCVRDRACLSSQPRRAG
eukprot:3982463-Lingulodinium_polyedra.AAC.1